MGNGERGKKIGGKVYKVHKVFKVCKVECVISTK